MRYVLYGNFLVSYCSEVHHALSIEALGHEVIRLQETEITTNQVLEESLKSNGLIWIHSHGFVNKGRPMIEVLDILREKGIPTLAYHLDLYMGIERWKEYKNSPYINKLQHFFTVDKLMADYLNKETNTKGHYLPAGVLHKECYALDLPKRYDVVFVGSRGYHKEWDYRPLLLDWLRDTYNRNFFHFGGDGLGVVRGHDLNELYSASKVIIGDTLCPNFNYPYYISDRLFETIGRNGFVIFPYITGIRDFFTENELVTYTYGNFAELKEKIDYYLTHDDEREAIRKAGHERAKREHTYLHRWKKIIETI